ncbi:protocadherin gamma-C5-like, partial [Pyxicephalus adspersus]|uniref:protocadherin gamma-C5-like n=1 Tax=Pyxicephalus adspersus TaxID=30357 RepID=UPI003B5ADC80
NAWKWQVAFSLLLCSWGWVSGQLHYSVAEESDPGTVVGNIAQDLGVNLANNIKRKLSLRSEESSKFFSIDQKHGALIIQERIDRESLCVSRSSCLLHLEVVAENPFELFSIELEILDINDNYPLFSLTNQTIKITELLTNPGVRFPLPSAEDLDVGKNGVRHYSLNPNPYFSLSEKYRSDGTLIAELVLEKNLDREEKSEHKLILTAIDGGEPPRSGSTQIIIIVLDINDNAPVFDQESYKVELIENLPPKTVVIKLNATDLDEGANSEILYSFDDHTLNSAKKIFDLNEITGEIFMKGTVDYEVARMYELFVKAVDKGSPTLEGRCVVKVEIQDVNDNVPEILFTSKNNEVPENAPLGTIVGFITVRDRDSGTNGEIKLITPPNLPFKCQPTSNRYTLVTSGHLDREKVSQYTITLIASDLGSTSLFSLPLMEENLPDQDPLRLLLLYLDEGANSEILYSFDDHTVDSAKEIFNLNEITGEIDIKGAIDFEVVTSYELFVKAVDKGSPTLEGRCVVHIEVQDMNDNAPEIIFTSKNNKVPENAPLGTVVGFITVRDRDFGKNGEINLKLPAELPFKCQTMSNRYTLVTSGHLDREKVSQYTITLIASDLGSPWGAITVLYSHSDCKYNGEYCSGKPQVS